MTVYKLLRILLVHALHGRGKDEVFTCVTWDLPETEGVVVGEVRTIEWSDARDGFITIDAVNMDPSISFTTADGYSRCPAWEIIGQLTFVCRGGCAPAREQVGQRGLR